MGLLVAIILIFFSVVSVVVYSICVTNKVKTEQERHIAALNNPYRIVLNENNQFCIQHYEPNKYVSDWIWMNTTEVFDVPEAAKLRYCQLMAEFRYKCEDDSVKLAKNELYSVNGVRIHKVLDMSDSIEIIDRILKKIKEERNPVAKKTRRRRRKNEETDRD